MKLLILSLFISFSLEASANVPAYGKFDWRKFDGIYKYESCQIKNNKPIWAERPESTTIEFSAHPEIEPNLLEITRITQPNTGILLGYSLAEINQGKKIEVNEETKKVIHTSESYTTKDGVYNFLSWNVEDINVGWATMQLKIDNTGILTYKTRLQFSDEADYREEVCNLSVTL